MRLSVSHHSASRRRASHHHVAHHGVSHHSVWRARIVGSLLVMPAYLAFYLADLLPLRGAQLLVFPALLAVYLAALRVRDGRSAVAWPLHLCEGVTLALFIRETGGAGSPFQAVAYPWLLGSALTLLLDGSRPAVVLLLSALAALALLIGGWGTDGFARFTLINSAALAAMVGSALTLNAERRAARADPLVPSILNRGAGLERLESWVDAGRPFYLSFIDLGGFKAVNDRYGHRVGDEVLRAVAERLRGSVRGGDAVIRYGGDEFVVATRTELPRERLEALFRVPVTTSAGEVAVRADVGSVACPPGSDLEALLHRADTLMYHRKRVRQAV